ncbi:MAG: IPT/TIG domain-containing protein [Candidatus Kapabacteria bacterium]|jgi:hypothetical protein|nr:IPT/TIG domain-containing protein [Candidatus Kapabacteria bacterium]
MRYSALVLVLVVLGFVRLSAQSTTTATIQRPYITETSPRNLVTGVDSTILTIRGGRFQQGATVLLNGRNLRTLRQEGDSVIVAVIGGELTITPDIATLMVENPNFTRIGQRIAIIASSQVPCGIVNRSMSVITVLVANPSVTTGIMSAFSLRVEGSGFTANTRVFWGTRELAINPQTTSATSVTALVPAELNIPGTYTISVIERDAPCLATLVTVNPYIEPTLWITRVFPFSLPPTGGRLTISGNGFSTRATVQLGQTTLATISISTNQILAVVPSGIGVGVYNLSVKNPDGSIAWQAYQISYQHSVLNHVADSPFLNQATTLSPNPAQTTLTFTTTLDRASNLTLTLRNTLGASVLTEQHTTAAGRFSVALDISTLASGVYLLETRDDAGSRWVQKVVKY